MTSSSGHHHIPCHHMCHATSSTMPCHAITILVISSLGHHHIPCHHMFHATSSTMPLYSLSSYMSCHILNYAIFLNYAILLMSYTSYSFVLPSYPLVIPLSFVNTFDINDNYNPNFPTSQTTQKSKEGS